MAPVYLRPANISIDLNFKQQIPIRANVIVDPTDRTIAKVSNISGDGALNVNVVRTVGGESGGGGGDSDVPLSTRLSEDTFTGRIGTKGQKTMSGSTPVVLASDQSAIPVNGSGFTQPISGTVTANQGGSWDFDIGDSANRDLGKVDIASLDQYTPVSGRLPVDGSGVTQPVSAASLPLPTGAATEATIATRAGEHITAVSPHASRLTDGSAFYKATTPSDTQPVSNANLDAALSTLLSTSAFQARVPTLGQKAMSGSVGVVLASDQSAIAVSGTVSVSGTVDIGDRAARDMGKIDVASLDQYTPVSGRLPVDGSGVTQPVSGTMTANIGTSGALALDATLANVLTTAAFQARVPVSGQGAMAASIPVVLASNQTVIPVSDNAGSITIDNANLDAAISTLLTTTAFQARVNTLGQKTMANSTPVALASDQAALPITDNSGSITVDSPGMPTALGQSTMAASMRVVLASDHSAISTSLSAAVPAGNNNIGDVDVATYPGPTAAQIPAALVGGRLDNNLGSIAGTAAVTGGVSGLLAIAGNIAHDGVDAGNPTKLGGKAIDTLPTAVGSLDRVDAWFDRKGRLHVAGSDRASSRTGIYYVHSGRQAVLASAHAATAGFLWIINPAGSSVLVAVRNVRARAFPAAVTVFASAPRVTLERVTFTGTASGATITAAQRDSTEAAPTFSVRTASTGMTLTAGATLGCAVVPIVMTAVGIAAITDQQIPVLTEDDAIILRAGQGVVLRQADNGTTSDTRILTADFTVEEYA